MQDWYSPVPLAEPVQFPTNEVQKSFNGFGWHPIHGIVLEQAFSPDIVPWWDREMMP